MSLSGRILGVVAGVGVAFAPKMGLVASALAVEAAAPLKGASSKESKWQTPELKKRISDYKKKLAAYLKARETYEKEAATYWQGIGEKRASRRAKRAGNE